MMDPKDIELRVIEAVPDPLAQIHRREISDLFGRRPTWFNDQKVKLETEGFPPPISPGVWLRRDVVRFMLARQHGLRPDQVPPLRSHPTLADAYDQYEALRQGRRRPRKRVLR